MFLSLYPIEPLRYKYIIIIDPSTELVWTGYKGEVHTLPHATISTEDVQAYGLRKWSWRDL